MSESLVKSVQEMLNEEKWTRATISNYSINNFKDLDAIIRESQLDKSLDEIKTLCRITSYNVCYTKLLRSRIVLTISQERPMSDLIDTFNPRDYLRNNFV